MTARLSAAVALLFLSVLAGCAWWGFALARGILSDSPRAVSVGLTAFFLVQAVTWALTAALIVRARRFRVKAMASAVVLLAGLGLLGNLLYYFTPVAGAPLLVLVGLVSVPVLAMSRPPPFEAGPGRAPRPPADGTS